MQSRFQAHRSIATATPGGGAVPAGRAGGHRRLGASGWLGRLVVALAMVLLIGLAAPGSAEARTYASIVVDAQTGQVLRARNADTPVYPASLTKMMTLYLLFEALDDGRATLSSRMHVSDRAAGQPPSKLGVKAGSTIPVETAIKALAIKSANDVATVVAEFLAGTEWRFAKVMTARAHDLGMENTTFRNASGLPDRGQKSTARDMAVLSMALMRHFPQYYHYFGMSSFTYGGRTYKTHNNVVKTYEGADGLKTGYIRASGFNLAASAQRGDSRIVGVVFGGRTSHTRDAHMVKLLDIGFSRVSHAIARAPLPAPKPDIRLASALTQPIGQGDVSSGPELSALTDSWGIQVGAFGRLEAAREVAEQHARLLAPMTSEDSVVIAPRQTSRGTIYRARVMGLNRAEANRACDDLGLGRQACIVVHPDPDMAVAAN
ncbi:D-alanyl-D-alanine carboxypeptidase [Roseospirillum parvum]|uniref:D-alanyl-D-alanine carboxypeptidase n=1 Tax=Roseospirillum parvum TaxID=83401 RepID=A0A1G8D4T4_9PROT|nr:D-alanyl-D-alanine carboxypeptidase [Roseospirillum parvum]SDH52702.1 D-alanyl-D-alanine carboxypeptidase [Roseospirillum parvum]